MTHCKLCTRIEFAFTYHIIIDIPADIKEKLLDYVERYAMTLLYRILFCPPFTTDEEKDLAIQKRYTYIDGKVACIDYVQFLKRH